MWLKMVMNIELDGILKVVFMSYLEVSVFLGKMKNQEKSHKNWFHPKILTGHVLNASHTYGFVTCTEVKIFLLSFIKFNLCFTDK
jgi:hypothetical protein